MPDYVILTDSSADLSAEMVREAGVTVLPLSFTIQGGTYQNTPDNREMDPALFYDMLRAAFSSGLSTTCNSAEVAAEELREQYPQRKLYVVDTLCASLGQGLLVWLAAREQKKGRSIEEVRDWAEAHKQAVCHQFTVQDLKFLKRGGRITATTAVLGSMLQIKPLLHVDQEGKLTAVGKARGRHAALKALVDRMEKTVTDEGRETVFISHGDCRGDADKVAEMVRERFGTRDIRINYIGPVIGAHAGPGTLALFYLGSER